MKTAIATVSISGDLGDKLATIARAGFDGIEIFEQDFIAYDLSPREVGQMVRDHGLEIMLFQPFRDFEGLPEPDRSSAFARAERKFDVMGELGVDLMLVCSSVHRHSLGGIDRAAADFRELGERAARRNLRVGYEALAWGRHIHDHRDAWEIVRRADHPQVGLILDSFHTLGRKIDPESIRGIPGDRIFFVQLADAPLIEMDLLYWSRHFRNMPGEGDLDVTRFMRAVMATGYKGPISLEIFNDQFRSTLPHIVAEDGHRSLVYLMDKVQKAEPGLAINLPVLPPPAKVLNFEFLEFATSESEVRSLETLLSLAGFARVGRHVSKPVSLWRQGSINILVNTGKAGFNHTAYINHGTSVSEVALKVANAQEANARALGLGAKPFQEVIAPGELRIPGLRGMSGSVLRFIDECSGLDRLWEVDFRLDVETPTDGVGLLKVDHIAQTMHYGEMLSATQFYTSIFEAGRSPMIDIADPDGLVRSQAIESPDGAFRITLNGAENHRTQAGRFISETFGASVQHLAFTAADIFATAQALVKNQFPVLQIGQNYFDDLGARFGLEPAFLECLRRANILYDRDEHGEFFQLYSRAFGEGMFLEIVERRNGYRGYGGPNAPFRTAAQRRAAPQPDFL